VPKSVAVWATCNGCSCLLLQAMWMARVQ